MRYFYHQPAADLRDLVGSYYLMEMPHAHGDKVRVEAPHIRFLLKGTSTLSIDDDVAIFDAPGILVCGPSFKAGNVSVTDNTKIVGASLTPEGWHRFLGVSAETYANRKVDLVEIRPGEYGPILDDLVQATSDKQLFDLIDSFLCNLRQPDHPVRKDFLEEAMSWALDPTSPGIDTLIDKVGLSPRQIDRLCRTYFGGSPKQVHRVYRALNIAHELALSNTTDWRDVAGGHYDQAHFIHDFKDRIGCTPTEFIDQKRMMIRFDIEKRSEIPHQSRFSMIA